MKIARHAEILKLISQYDIETQEELAARLNESGFSATQATISRDIRELKLTKVASEKGKVRYTTASKQDRETEGKYIRAFKDAVISMETAGNLLVIKTEAGMAMASAAALDELGWPEIIGCVAGDNTIFLATKSADIAEKILDKLKDIAGTF
jgi:transcriptional regulator of arginine metabolism